MTGYWLGLASAGLACGTGDRDINHGGVPAPGVGASDGSASAGADTLDTTGTSTDGTGDSGTAADGDSGAEPIFDVGTQSDAATPPASGCPAVDFLFVIDNSPSMGVYQQNLQSAFPEFITDMQASLADVDSYHVGVVTTDGNGQNSAQCMLIGALVTQTVSGICGPYAAGHNFMTEQDDLPTAFACASAVGEVGAMDEQPMYAMESALGQVQTAQDDQTPLTWQCNAGFLRSEALLVVVVLTDEPEGDNGSSPGYPSSWYDSVLEAKDDVPENIVVLTITNGQGCATPPNIDGGLSEFADLFGERGLKACIRDDFSGMLGDSIETITQACEGYVPPG